MKKYIFTCFLILLSGSTWAAGGWSAIAYDTTTGNHGYAYGTYNKQQAESNAIAGCNAYNCKVVASVYNGYAALAVSKSDKSTYGAGYAPENFTAMYWAMYYCNRGPTSCHIIRTVHAHD